MFGDCVPPILFIDASTDAHEEEEVYEEEEEHFDTNGEIVEKSRYCGRNVVKFWPNRLR